MIPLLVTIDLEYACDHDIMEQGNILEKLNEDLHSLNLPVTVFSTSEFVDKYTEQVRYIVNNKNEIGCHGFKHLKNENYRFLKEDKIKSLLITADKNIENKLQKKPVCFRGPGMTTSSIAQKILIDLEYIADFSVCSQRIDFMRSKGGNTHWLVAPRESYHPSRSNPYTKGDLPIWVVPMKCFAIPFISGMLYLFGLRFMKQYFNWLIKESFKKKSPIVYLFHSYEFTSLINVKNIVQKERFNRPFLHKLYKTDFKERYEKNLKFIKYMLSFEDIKPFTGKEYCKILSENSN